VNEDFSQFVFGGPVSGVPSGAMVQFDPDGDCVEALITGENFYGKPIGRAAVTLYIGQETGKIVGMLVEGISKGQQP
jgi:hypothetical protein